MTSILSIGTAVPPFRIGQKEGGEILIEYYKDKLKPRSIGVLRKLFEHPSIAYRSFAMDDPQELFKEDADSRIARFGKWSVNLSSDAALQALNNAQAYTEDVKGLIVNTCTGYICPGISTYILEQLGLSHDVRVYDLVGSGCGGAIPNLQLAQALAEQIGDGVILSVSSEICSATFQMSDDLSLLVSNTLFGDGAAAAVVAKSPLGRGAGVGNGEFEIIDSLSITLPEHREYIRYIHKNGQLHNQLSMKLGDFIRKAAASVVGDLLSRWSLRVADIDHWALHTGGEKIINAVSEEIGLDEEQLSATRSILMDYGNMSSPTVMFVLKKLLESGMRTGDRCVMVAFGAGLSAHACLLKKS